MNEDESTAFGRAIGDATRQEIMRFCCCDWRSVGAVAVEVKVSQPTVSHHLAVLREAGLVKSRKDGKQVFYTLDQRRVVSCCGKLLFAFAPDEKATKSIRRCCG
jgi:ArsR family transcriptional regulator, arsenate/arsenite/antimonite-responsive transcriptional repressor